LWGTTETTKEKEPGGREFVASEGGIGTRGHREKRGVHSRRVEKSELSTRGGVPLNVRERRNGFGETASVGKRGKEKRTDLAPVRAFP